jgi:SAM-dependent methyltransferase
MSNEKQKELLRLEAAFWDRQEDEIADLYARPHDWRFAPEIANRIILPKINFLKGFVDKMGPQLGSLLDIGCGNGWLCHAVAEWKIHAYGCDLSPKKIETANAIARERGISEYCHFFAGDIMDFQIPGKVDLMTAQGSLHHFPELETILPLLVDRFLKPDGYMLFVEPHHEGMSPGIMKTLLWLANRPWIGKLFDKEFYLEVSGQKPGAPAAHADSHGHHHHGSGELPKADEFNIRGESPAGLAFFGEEPDMSLILKSRYQLVEEKYFLYFLGHVSNAFYIYMKSPFMKRLYRFLLPVLIRLDDFLNRFPRFNKWAEEGAWVLKR